MRGRWEVYRQTGPLSATAGGPSVEGLQPGTAAGRMRHALPKSLLTTAVLALTITGCATLESFTAPDVTLVDVRFEDLTVFETSGTFTVRLSNENPEPMVVDGAVYKLYLGGQRVGKALSEKRIEVPRLGSSVYEVDVYINNVALVARLLTLGQERGAGLHDQGQALCRAPLRVASPELLA